MISSTLIIIIIIILLIVIGILLLVVFLRKRSFGTISGNNIYSDTKQMPGKVLYSDALKLKGKPDYIIKKGNEYIPVEVKTGKTPDVPYKNHVAQLFAYCALVNEEFSVRPKYGVIKYPEREFEIEYTPQGEKGVELLVQEMTGMLNSGEEPKCRHPEHNIISS